MIDDPMKRNRLRQAVIAAMDETIDDRPVNFGYVFDDEDEDLLATLADMLGVNQ